MLSGGAQKAAGELGIIDESRGLAEQLRAWKTARVLANCKRLNTVILESRRLEGRVSVPSIIVFANEFTHSGSKSKTRTPASRPLRRYTPSLLDSNDASATQSPDTCTAPLRFACPSQARTSDPTPRESGRIISPIYVCGGCGLAPSSMRTTTMLAAWTPSASLSWAYWG